MKKTVANFKKIILYFFIHLISFVINYFVYFLLMIMFYRDKNIISIQIINFISWVLSMLFIFFVEKFFMSNLIDENNNEELFKFFLIRLISLILEGLILFVFVSIIGYNPFSVKFISLLILFFVNYIYTSRINIV